VPASWCGGIAPGPSITTTDETAAAAISSIPKKMRGTPNGENVRGCPLPWRGGIAPGPGFALRHPDAGQTCYAPSSLTPAAFNCAMYTRAFFRFR